MFFINIYLKTFFPEFVTYFKKCPMIVKDEKKTTRKTKVPYNIAHGIARHFHSQ